MAEKSDWLNSADWGYHLLPKSHPECPGNTGLLVVIREKPTQKHFDPETLDLCLVQEASIDHVTLTLKAPFEEAKAGPGRVFLRDRFNKQVDFFCFGGQLTAEARPAETLYALRSPAPILELRPNLETVPDQLAAEVEMMLGVFQARWDEKTFDQQMARTDPFQLYLACLGSILLRYERARPLQLSYREFYGALLREKVWLLKMGRWPASPPSLGALLGAQKD